MPPPLKRFLKGVRMWLLLHFRYRLLSCGPGTYIDRGCFIFPGSTRIGAHSFIGSNCRLASWDLTIGNYVMLAGSVAVVGGDHRFDRVGTPMIHAGLADPRPVRIEDDVWIGHGAIILHGITIGEGAVVAAGSIVTRDVAPYTIVAGGPARPLRARFDAEQIQVHRAALADLRTRLGLTPPGPGGVQG
jgi:acetyltransferase-like isoleucine patch superfamily enzyme